MSRTSGSNPALDPKTVRWIRVRVVLLALTFIPLLGSLLWRAVQLQILDAPRLHGMAKDQYVRRVQIAGSRGPVFDRRGAALAATAEVDSIFATPSDMTDTDRAAAQLAKLLHVDAKKLASAFNGGKSFAWVKRRVTEQEAKAVRALNLAGIGFVKEPRRFYPQRELAAHVLGFSGVDGEGLEGVELAFDDLLRGKPQLLSGLRDARGRAAILDGPAPAESLQGASVTLTIDRAIQYAAEKALASAVTQANAVAGTAVVLDPSTGELLAVANVPTFNPNDAGRYQKQALRNRALTDQFEPGSTFKIFSVGAALEEKAIRPNDVFDCEHGRYAIGKRAIHDHGGYGALDVGRIIQVSSNIGVAKIAERLGREKLAAYHRAFGFGDKPGTGLPGETRGALPFPKADIALATQSFGQGLTASAVQIAAAYGAVANHGVLMRPYVVSRVVDADGVVAVDRQPERVRQVISGATAKQLIKFMKLVVEKDGTAPRARMDDYAVAGKTGTAQKVDPATGNYSVDKRTASFVGLVPADEPRLVIGVWIDEPKGDVYGGLVAAPAFKEIAQSALSHLGVPPSSTGALVAARTADEKPAASAAPEAKSRSSEIASAARGDAAGEGFIEDDAPAGEDATLVPDVQGMTARAAVQALSAARLEISLTGSGKAIGQTPPPGSTVARGTRVAVRLQTRI